MTVAWPMLNNTDASEVEVGRRAWGETWALLLQYTSIDKIVLIGMNREVFLPLLVYIYHYTH